MAIRVKWKCCTWNTKKQRNDLLQARKWRNISPSSRLLPLAPAVAGISGLVQGDPEYFVVWVVLTYFAIALFGWQWHRDGHGLGRWIGPAGSVVGAGLFTWQVALVGAPLNVTARSMPFEYGPGTKIGDIQWRPEYTRVEVSINNPTSRNYEELDIVIDADQVLAAATFRGATCAEPTIEDAERLGINMSDNRGSGYDLSLMATEGGYRVKCARLDRFSTLSVVLAAVTMKPGLGFPSQPNANPNDPNFAQPVPSHLSGNLAWFGHVGGDIYGGRPSVETVTVAGTYIAVYRRRAVSITRSADRTGAAFR
jgi:hypothetical protein